MKLTWTIKGAGRGLKYTATVSGVSLVIHRGFMEKGPWHAKLSFSLSGGKDDGTYLERHPFKDLREAKKWAETAVEAFLLLVS